MTKPAKHRSGRRKRYGREMNHDGSGRYRSGNIHPASDPQRDPDATIEDEATRLQAVQP